MDEGSKYPVYTNDNSRKKYLADGAGAVYYWWERDPYVSYSHYFCTVNTGGNPSSSYGAYNSYGVSLGFCSGEASA